MARGPDLVRFCRKHQLLMITVADLAQYRKNAGAPQDFVEEQR